jgi:hypothetical protein
MQHSIDEDVIIEDINMIEIVDSKHSNDLMDENNVHDHRLDGGDDNVDDNNHDGGNCKETNGRTNCKIIQSKSMTVKNFQIFVNYNIVVVDDDADHDDSRNSNNKMDLADDNDNDDDNNNNNNNNNNIHGIMMIECLLSCYIIQYTENSIIYHELLITCIDLNHDHHHHQLIKRNVYCLRYFLPEVFKNSIVKQKNKFDLNENVNDDIGSVDKIDSLNNIKLEIYSRDNDDNNITDVSILLCIEGNYYLKNSISSSSSSSSSTTTTTTTTTTKVLTNTFLIRLPICHQNCIFNMLSFSTNKDNRASKNNIFHLDKKNYNNDHYYHYHHIFPLSINTIISSKGLSNILPLQKVFYNSALYCRLIPLRNVMILRSQGSRGIAIISNLVGKVIVLDIESNDDETDDDDDDEDDNGDDDNGDNGIEDSNDDEDDEVETGGGR